MVASFSATLPVLRRYLPRQGKAKRSRTSLKCTERGCRAASSLDFDLTFYRGLTKRYILTLCRSLPLHVVYRLWAQDVDKCSLMRLGSAHLPVIHPYRGGNNDVLDGSPSYSPNAKRIAYAGWDGHDLEIYTINPNGTGKFQVTKNGANDTDPAYSPSGRRIALSGFDGKDFEIYTIDVHGKNRVQVTKNATNDYDPAYSPSGRRIAYSGFDGKDFDIYTISVRGEKRVQVTKNGLNDAEPSYSPNANKITYSGADGNDNDIYTVNPDGGGKLQVTKNATRDYAPSWGSRP